MSKRRFIQSVIIRRLPEIDKLKAAVEYAEALWGGLSAHGYGPAEPGTPREGIDWYAQLSDRQRLWFDKFWGAFGYKHGRNQAAMRWYQLGELADDEYRQIIDAAGKEAAKRLPDGQARKMAQGWLHERRYLDYLPTAGAARADKTHILRRLESELTGVKRLYAATSDKALLAGIERLTQAIEEAKKK